MSQTNLRAVYMNDPFPPLPFNDVLDYFHAGTEVHFYECKNYFAYPTDSDDFPMFETGKEDDHYAYPCLESTIAPNFNFTMPNFTASTYNLIQ
jgi:hypothetical protein